MSRPDGPPQEPPRAPQPPAQQPPPAPPPAPPVFAVTGNARADSVLGALDNAIKPFRDAPPPEQGTVGVVAQFVSGAVGLINAPAMFIDSAVSQGVSSILAATGLSALFPALPVATIGTTMHIGTPHTHVHPPSLVPPAPPIPLPSIGIAFLAGSASVLVNGIPALRAGDIGLGLTCGSLAPPFEIMTGASGVYFAGARAARIGMDITFHCNPAQPAGALSTALGVAGIVGGALGAAAQAVAGNTTAAAAQAAQAGLDAAAMAIKALRGKDPAGPPGIGVLLGPPTTVLAGGPPIPNVGAWAQGKIYGALGKLASKTRQRFRKAPAPDDNGKKCDAGEPVHVVTGENYDTHVDFVSRHGGFRWARFLSSAKASEHGVMGRGGRHVFESRLEVRLHRVTFVAFDGARIELPRLRRGEDVIREKGYVLTRLSDTRYRLSHRRLGTLDFALDGPGRVHARLVSVSSPRALVDLGYDDQRRLVEITEHARLEGEPERASLVPGRRSLLPGGGPLSLPPPDTSRPPPARYELRYDAEGHLAEVVEVDGLRGLRTSMQTRRLAAYAYDPHGRLVVAEDALGARQRFAYDAAHRLTESTDRNGYRFRWSYDAEGRVSETQGEDGLWYARFRYERGKTHVTAHDGTVRTFHFDDDGVITRVDDGLGGFVERLRDDDGRVIAEVDAAGQRVELLYDDDGAHVARRDRFGATFPPELDDPRPPRRVVRDLPRTPRGRLLGKLVDELPATTATAAEGRVDGRGEGLLAMVPRELVSYAHATLPPAERPTPSQRHDDRGRLVHEVTAEGRQRELGHDAAGNEITSRDGDGRVTEQRIVSWNLVGARIDPLGNKTSYQWTAHERLRSIVDPLGASIQLEHDGKDRLTRVHRDGLLRESYAYDLADRLVEKRGHDGAPLLRVTPHENGLPGTIALVPDATEITLDYDRWGWVREAVTREHHLVRTMFPDGRVARERCDGFMVDHLYARDPETKRGGWLARTAIGRFAIHYRRDGAGVLTIVDPAGRARRVQHDGLGRVHVDHGQGTHELLRFDAGGRLDRRLVWRVRRDGALRTWSTELRYSAEGALRAVFDSARGTRQLGLDDAHRLISDTDDHEGTRTYVHDAAGNLVGSPDVDGFEVERGNRLRRAGAEHFDYDARGHLALRRSPGRTIRYVHDALDRLVRVEDGRGAPWTATYDGLGRLVSCGRGERRTRLLWSGDRLAAERSPEGRLRIYVHADAHALVPLGFVDYESEDAPPESGRSYAVFSDAIGMPLQIEDAEGRVVWLAERIDPWGAVSLREVAPRGAAPIDYALRWPGHRYDDDLGLHYNRFRWYDPRLGRYLEPDPIGARGGTNLYAYPSNPLVSVDVLGLHNEHTKQSGDESETTPLRDESDTTTHRQGEDGTMTPRSEDRAAVLQKARQDHLNDCANADTKKAATLLGLDEATVKLAAEEGSTQAHVDARERVLAAYVGEENLGSHIKGHDLTQPLFVGPPPPKPTTLSQYQIPPLHDADGSSPGQYFADSQYGFTPDELGIASQGQDWHEGASDQVHDKNAYPVQVPGDNPYLQSVNAATTDSWSHAQSKTPVWTGGGAVQIVHTKQRRQGVTWL